MCQGSFGFSVTDSDSVAERFELSVGVIFWLGIECICRSSNRFLSYFLKPAYGF